MITIERYSMPEFVHKEEVCYFTELSAPRLCFLLRLNAQPPVELWGV